MIFLQKTTVLPINWKFWRKKMPLFLIFVGSGENPPPKKHFDFALKGGFEIKIEAQT